VEYISMKEYVTPEKSTYVYTNNVS